MVMVAATPFSSTAGYSMSAVLPSPVSPRKCSPLHSASPPTSCLPLRSTVATSGTQPNLRAHELPLAPPMFGGLPGYGEI